MKLETRIRRQFKAHVEKRHGLITAPDELLDHILTEVEKWLAQQKQEYRVSNSIVRMECAGQRHGVHQWAIWRELPAPSAEVVKTFPHHYFQLARFTSSGPK